MNKIFFLFFGLILSFDLRANINSFMAEFCHKENQFYIQDIKSIMEVSDNILSKVRSGELSGGVARRMHQNLIEKIEDFYFEKNKNIELEFRKRNIYQNNLAHLIFGLKIKSGAVYITGFELAGQNLPDVRIERLFVERCIKQTHEVIK